MISLIMTLICFAPLITMSYNQVLYYHHCYTVSYQYALNAFVVKHFTRQTKCHILYIVMQIITKLNMNQNILVPY